MYACMQNAEYAYVICHMHSMLMCLATRSTPHKNLLHGLHLRPSIADRQKSSGLHTGTV